MFSGLKSIIYPSVDINKDKRFWQSITGIAPNFDQPYYVSFMINGQELGLDPNAKHEGITYPIAYWHVDNVHEATKQLLADGASIDKPLRDVGGGMIMASFKDLSGNIFGIIDNPNE